MGSKKAKSIRRYPLITVKESYQFILHKEWFDMIYSGKKLEEYRELTGYWTVRLRHLYPFFDTEFKSVYIPIVESIIFSNGYGANRRQFEIEFLGAVIRRGNPEWGAVEGKSYFVIQLGKVIQSNFENESVEVGYRLNTPIKELNLSIRLFNCIERRLSCHTEAKAPYTLRDIGRVPLRDWRLVRCLGSGLFDELKELMKLRICPRCDGKMMLQDEGYCIDCWQKYSNV